MRKYGAIASIVGFALWIWSLCVVVFSGFTTPPFPPESFHGEGALRFQQMASAVVERVQVSIGVGYAETMPFMDSDVLLEDRYYYNDTLNLYEFKQELEDIIEYFVDYTAADVDGTFTTWFSSPTGYTWDSYSGIYVKDVYPSVPPMLDTKRLVELVQSLPYTTTVTIVTGAPGYVSGDLSDFYDPSFIHITTNYDATEWFNRGLSGYEEKWTGHWAVVTAIVSQLRWTYSMGTITDASTIVHSSTNLVVIDTNSFVYSRDMGEDYYEASGACTFTARAFSPYTVTESKTYIQTNRTINFDISPSSTTVHSSVYTSAHRTGTVSVMEAEYTLTGGSTSQSAQVYMDLFSEYYSYCDTGHDDFYQDLTYNMTIPNTYFGHVEDDGSAIYRLGGKPSTYILGPMAGTSVLHYVALEEYINPTNLVFSPYWPDSQQFSTTALIYGESSTQEWFHFSVFGGVWDPEQSIEASRSSTNTFSGTGDGHTFSISGSDTSYKTQSVTTASFVFPSGTHGLTDSTTYYWPEPSNAVDGKVWSETNGLWVGNFTYNYADRNDRTVFVFIHKWDFNYK